MTVVLPTFSPTLVMGESSELITAEFSMRENLIPSTGTASSKTRVMVSGTSFVYKYELPTETGSTKIVLGYKIEHYGISVNELKVDLKNPKEELLRYCSN